MLEILLASGVVVGFASLLKFFHLTERAEQVRRRARTSWAILQNSDLTDRQKEEEMRKQAGALFKLLFILVSGSVLAIGLPLLGVLLLEQMGVSSLAGVWGMLENPWFLLGTFIVGGLFFLFQKQQASSREAS